MKQDNLDDINALMVASSTIKSASKKVTVAERKKLRLRKEFAANISMLAPEDPNVVQEKAKSYVQAFYDKVQERLELHEYHRFMEILNVFDEKTGKATDLFLQVNKIFSPKYPELADEFLTFLTPVQAKSVGKLKPHFMLKNMSLFLQKLEIYFKDQPSQLRKIYRNLTELACCVDVTMDLVKNSILPLLKGNSLLTDWFLQIFPSEKPPERYIF